MREGDVHPAVVIEIENGNSRGRRGDSARPHIAHWELAFARILKNRRRLSPSRKDDVDGAIIVVVGPQRRSRPVKYPASPVESVTSVNVPLPLLRHMLPVPAASITGSERIPQTRVVLTGIGVARYVEIKIAVVVVVDERQP